jgi:hypothetical protein
MRTKTLLLTAAVVAAGALASQAQVYSVNAVGYVNTPVTVGYKLIANPLNTTNNSIGALLPTPPDFTTLYKWNESSQGFEIATYFFGSWDHPEFTLNPGEGAVISVPENYTITWVGEVLQGTAASGILSNSVPTAYSIRSSKVPQGGTLTTLAFPTPNEFDTLYKWNVPAQGYDIYTYFFGEWSGPQPGEPSIGVGESFFYSGNGTLTWNRTFSVN